MKHIKVNSNRHANSFFFARLIKIAPLLVIAACASDESLSLRAPIVSIEPSAPAKPIVVAPVVATPPIPPVETYRVTITPPLVPLPDSPENKPQSLTSWVSQGDRLYRVAGPLLIKNTRLCPKQVRNILGFTAKTKYSYSNDFIAEAQNELGLEDRLRVMSVLPQSGASLAGLKVGDILLVAGIEPLPEGSEAEHEAAALISSELPGRSELSFDILRDGERLNVDIPLTPACAMTVVLGDTDDIRSYADGERIMVSRGMLKFIASDDELAYVLARDIAYNIIAPSPDAEMSAAIDRLRTLNKNPRLVSDASVALTLRLGEDGESLAIDILNNAGYDTGSVRSFWKKLGDAISID